MRRKQPRKADTQSEANLSHICLPIQNIFLYTAWNVLFFSVTLPKILLEIDLCYDIFSKKYKPIKNVKDLVPFPMLEWISLI